MLALHGVFQAIGAEHVLALGTTAQATAVLRALDAVLVVIVGLLAQHDAVLHQRLVHAHAGRAAVPARHGNPLGALLGVSPRRCARLGKFHRVLALGAAGGQSARKRRGSSCGGTCLNESAAADRRAGRLIQITHLSILLFLSCAEAHAPATASAYARHPRKSHKSNLISFRQVIAEILLRRRRPGQSPLDFPSFSKALLTP